MGSPPAFWSSGAWPPRCRAVEERIRDWEEIPLPASAEELAREARPLHGLRGSLLPRPGLPPGQPDPGVERRGLPRPLARGLAAPGDDQPLPGAHRQDLPRPLREPPAPSPSTPAPWPSSSWSWAIIERAFAEGWVEPRPPRRETGRRVAVIGSGPAGLAAAQGLRRQGHTVSLFEKAGRIGGLLRYGIPDFKLGKGVLERRLAQLAGEGVEFETGVTIGEDLSARYLLKKFDALVLAIGCGEPRDLAVPGRGNGGIHFAVEYLTQANQRLRRRAGGGPGDLGARQAGAGGRRRGHRGGLRRDRRSPGGPQRAPGGDPAPAPGMDRGAQPGLAALARRSCAPPPPTRKAAPGTGRSHVTQFSAGYDPWVRQAHLVRVEWRPGKGGRPEPVEVSGQRVQPGGGAGAPGHGLPAPPARQAAGGPGPGAGFAGQPGGGRRPAAPRAPAYMPAATPSPAPRWS